MQTPLAKVFFRLLLCGALTTAACGGQVAAGPDADTIGCLTDPAAMSYTPGMSVPGISKLWTFSLVSSSPGPPGKGIDDWVVQIADPSGAPVTGLSVTAKPWMPKHGHGTSVVPVVTPMTGGYDVNPLYLFMPGLWQVTITGVRGSQSDSAAFSFCIQG